jgi:hypothetical protein
MDRFQFLKVKQQGKDLGMLTPIQGEAKTQALVDNYFSKLVGSNLVAHSKYFRVEYKVRSWKKGIMKIVITGMVVNAKEVDTFRNYREMIQVHIDDHLLQVVNQYFNVYVTPKIKIFYTKSDYIFRRYAVL